jgi:RNA polymerase sigma-70 factor, ECF subfamily
VFVQLVQNMPELEQRETVLPWVYRVATNHCLNLRRTRQRQGLPAGVDLDVLPSAATVSYPERQLAAAVLSRFDVTTQAIAIGILVDGMEQQEAAAVLGLSTRTVSRKLERFLVNARKYLARSAA